MKHLLRKILLLSVFIYGVLILGGCGTKFQNISPKGDFIAGTNKRVAIAWLFASAPEQRFEATHSFLGQNGLLDIAVANAFAAELKDQLSTIDAPLLITDKLFGLLKSGFENKGFVVKIEKEPYCIKEFRLFSNPKCEKKITQTDQNLLGIYEFPQFEPTFDFTPIFSQLDVDYLIFFWPIRHGTARSYYGGIPTSPPKGVTTIMTYLVDRQGSKIIAKHLSSVVETVNGEWDQPPKYDNLMKAVTDSFETATDEIYIHYLQEAP